MWKKLPKCVVKRAVTDVCEGCSLTIVQMPRRQASHPILKVKNENLRRDARQRTDELPAHNQRDIVFFPVGDDGRYEPAHFQ